MIPITHFVYVALGLVVCGLGGALLRRSAHAVAIGLAIAMTGAALLFVAYARWWGNMDGQAAALIVVVLAVVQLMVGLTLSGAAAEE